jgi:hypothetical protein
VKAFTIGANVVGAAAFVYAMHVLGWTKIQSALDQMGWGLAAIVGLSGLREGTRALAWTKTVEGPDRLSLRDAFEARLAGEALNTLLPMGFLLGEPAKAQYLVGRLPFTIAFRAQLIEFAFYCASLILLFGAAAFSVLSALAAASLVAPALLAVSVARKSQRVLQSLHSFAARRGRWVWGILALEVSYHALGIAEVYIILMLISPRPATWASAVMFETVNRVMTMAFKMVPLRIGVDEVTAAMTSQRLALGTSTGLMLALVRKLRMLLWGGVGVMFAATRPIRRPGVAVPATPTIGRLQDGQSSYARHLDTRASAPGFIRILRTLWR